MIRIIGRDFDIIWTNGPIRIMLEVSVGFMKVHLGKERLILSPLSPVCPVKGFFERHVKTIISFSPLLRIQGLTITCKIPGISEIVCEYLYRFRKRDSCAFLIAAQLTMVMSTQSCLIHSCDKRSPAGRTDRRCCKSIGKTDSLGSESVYIWCVDKRMTIAGQIR